MRARFLLVALLPGCADRPPARAELPPPPVATTQSAPGDRPGVSPACEKGAASATGVLPKKVPIAGKTRAYTLVVPASYAPGTSYPLVYVLHGHGGSGAQARTSFDLESVADGKALFVYPDAPGGWDLDSPAAKNADVALFDASLAQIQGAYCVDLRRVFVAGFSNGAYMANQLACRRGERIRGVASHAGGGPYETSGQYDEQGNLVCSGKPVASLVVHGTADATVAPSEGQKSIDHWTHANHCSGTGGAAPAGCTAHASCTNPVVTCKVPGLGHGLWPQAKTVTWQFFQSL